MFFFISERRLMRQSSSISGLGSWADRRGSSREFAQIRDDAVFTVWLSRCADVATMQDQKMMCVHEKGPRGRF